MGDKINIVASNIKESMIGGTENRYINVNEAEWREIEQLLRDALKRTSDQSLAKQALELTERRDKSGLKKLVREHIGEFTKNILTGAAADILLKFLL